ncbi:hypothetical protein AO1008_07168 [Aspergillus oryzae 100-8]|uniref:Rhodopsin domain-containing protein n=1 Tax=Aspergillus oryzae (strain 3.042) TaxID=1160506 RepID=I8IN84_ASPO3|nr:hypothetical protein Ao3042_02983 [Aspergillus oryzae 3.042]KDE81040.1 hypothetical protein AO1008_07168 [Aspergillus oryzae 100-8]|eukprot:EIT80681.1 hypothetical protein Ao3042_02983 [Aspergillus oryzae 3.042]
MASSPNQDTPIPTDHRTTAGLLAEYYTLTVIALSLVLLRAWVCLRLTRNWGWDDTCIVIAWIALLAGLITIQLEANLGLGRHAIYLPDPEHTVLQILKVNTIYQIFNVICALVTKYSISFYILRIRNSRDVRWILAWLMLFMTLATTGAAVILAVSCIPLEKQWNKDVPGTCLFPKTAYSVAYVQSGFTIVIDLCLTSAPVIILWDVKIKRGRKTLICGLMSLGLVATVSNALRNCYQGGLTAPDMPYAITNVAIVSILEVGTGVIAACIPACVPAFRCRQKAEPVANSYRDKKISVIRGGRWDEGSGNWSLGNAMSDSIALCGVKSPGRVVTKVTAC